MLTEATRHNWQLDEVVTLIQSPLIDLLYQAQSYHRQFFKPSEVQLSALLSLKTDACRQDRRYCSQSGHHDTGSAKQKLLPVTDVVNAAKRAKQHGITRFCMAGAWHTLSKKDMPTLLAMVRAVKALGLEIYLSADLLKQELAERLAEVGLNYYNHNLDTSAEYYLNIISTWSFSDRLTTLENVRRANIKVCCGDILGLGESHIDRASLLQTLANLDPQPESVPINQLVTIPVAETKQLDEIEFVRTVAVARIMMPKTHVHLSAGRSEMSQAVQTLCFLAGVNSIHYSGKLLTTPSPTSTQDQQLFAKLGLPAAQLA